jgi:hypothetical protein
VTGTQGATIVSSLRGTALSATAPTVAGQVLKYNGTSWAPGADTDTTYSAGNGLTLTGTSFAASYAGSGGDLGAALTLARSDHIHDVRYYQKAEVDALLTNYVPGGTFVGSITGPLTYPQINANGYADRTINVDNAVLSDAIALGVPNAAVLPGMIYFGWVSSPGVVTIRAMNTGNTQTPPTATFRVTVIRYQ